MEYKKLTPGPWGMSADKFGQLKELLIRWLKPIPAEQFSRCDDMPWFDEDDPTWRYTPRYLKSCFLRKLRSAGHISEIPGYLSYLPEGSEERVVVFLCSKLAVTHPGIVQPLIDYVKNDDHAQQLACNYETILEHGLENVCYWQQNISPDRGLKLFTKIKPERRLREPESYYMLENLTLYSPEHKSDYR